MKRDERFIAPFYAPAICTAREATAGAHLIIDLLLKQQYFNSVRHSTQ